MILSIALRSIAILIVEKLIRTKSSMLSGVIRLMLSQTERFVSTLNAYLGATSEMIAGLEETTTLAEANRRHRMTRCQHCYKLTHAEDLIVEYELCDQEKVRELVSLKDWTPKPCYSVDDPHFVPEEFGKLRCGDIVLHFRVKMSTGVFVDDKKPDSRDLHIAGSFTGGGVCREG